MSHWPSIDRLVPCPVHVPPVARARLRLEATAGLAGSENSSRTPRAGRGRPESYRRTRTANRLGPTVPGDAVRRTRAVVAKSLPVTVTEGETVF